MLYSTPLSAEPVFASTPSLNRGICWLFASNNDLSPHFEALALRVDAFLAQWAAHGTQVEAGAALICGHFLVIAEGQGGGASSGCSQDALRSMVQGLEKQLGTVLLAGGRIFYRNAEGGVEVTSRMGFQAAAKSGQVGPETWVFDTLVQSAADLKLGRFLCQAKDSWHLRLLPVAEKIKV